MKKRKTSTNVKCVAKFQTKKMSVADKKWEKFVLAVLARMQKNVAKPDEIEIRSALPPKKGSPKGPIDSPVPTEIKLLNGAEQPFIYVNFYGNIIMTGNQFVK